MGAIAVSIFVSAVAVIGLICFNKKDKKNSSSSAEIKQPKA